MPVAATQLRREAIQRTLAQRAGGAPDAHAVAAATLSTWHQVAAHLEPVIGAKGVDVLLGRSLHLTGRDFPWLAIPGIHASSDVSLANVKLSLAARDAALATEASCALLLVFTELLATLIGDSLTERLLGAVWVSATPDPELEAAPCLTK